jgi:hypothetical protein
MTGPTGMTTSWESPEVSPGDLIVIETKLGPLLLKIDGSEPPDTTAHLQAALDAIRALAVCLTSPQEAPMTTVSLFMQKRTHSSTATEKTS